LPEKTQAEQAGFPPDTSPGRCPNASRRAAGGGSFQKCVTAVRTICDVWLMSLRATTAAKTHFHSALPLKSDLRK
jgi:hypothetical protein